MGKFKKILFEGVRIGVFALLISVIVLLIIFYSTCGIPGDHQQICGAVLINVTMAIILFGVAGTIMFVLRVVKVLRRS